MDDMTTLMIRINLDVTIEASHLYANDCIQRRSPGEVGVTADSSQKILPNIVKKQNKNSHSRKTGPDTNIKKEKTLPHVSKLMTFSILFF